MEGQNEKSIRFNRKSCYYKGASSGLGVEYASALANQGANIALVARRKEKIK